MAPTLMRSVLGRVATMPRRSISSFNKTPPPANRGPHSGGQQAMPLGAYYEAIITKPQPIPAKKPEEPPTTSEKSTTAPARKNCPRQPIPYR
jgi:hypothetical protein